jgi:hypothetical protein
MKSIRIPDIYKVATVAAVVGALSGPAHAEPVLTDDAGNAGGQQVKTQTPVPTPTRPAVTAAPAERGSWYFPAQFVNQAKDIEAHVPTF